MIYLKCFAYRASCLSPNLWVREINFRLRHASWIISQLLLNALGCLFFPLSKPIPKTEKAVRLWSVIRNWKEKNLSLCCYLLFAQLICHTIGLLSTLPFHTSHSACSSSASFFFFLLILSLPLSSFWFLPLHTHRCIKARSITTFSSVHSHTHPHPTFSVWGCV